MLPAMRPLRRAFLLLCFAMPLACEPDNELTCDPPAADERLSGRLEMRLSGGAFPPVQLVTDSAHMVGEPRGPGLTMFACDDSWDGYSHVQLGIGVPNPGGLPAPLSDGSDDGLPRVLARFGFCESETCPQQSGLTFGHYDTTFDGVIEAFDGEAGHLAMDFTMSMPDGSGRTLKLSVKGELNWDATYVAPMIEELTGSWLVSPDTVSPHWEVPFELQLRQDGTQLSGVICAGPLASDSSVGLNGDGGLDADGGAQVGSSSDAGIDGGAGFGCSGTPLTGYVAYGEGHLRWNLDDGTLAQLHVAEQDGALVATYERRPGTLQTGTWVSR